MEQRLQACAHYCDCKKGNVYVPDNLGSDKDVKFSKKQKSAFKSRFAATRTAQLLRGIPKTIKSAFRNSRDRLFTVLPFSVLAHKRYCSNNHLGLFITTVCNLGCFSCQVSARQAPANDIMSVEQVEKIVNEAVGLKYFWNKIFVTGGEPTLHPQFFGILDVLKKYKDFNPECQVIIETNGAGEKVQAQLKKMPAWVVVRNSSKDEGKSSYEFFSYNIAPIDTIAYKFSDFSKGCSRLDEAYGLCATMYGYYPCSPCMNVARVFGFDIGIKDLSMVTERSIRDQLKVLCQYCGWFREPVDSVVSAETMSASWQKALSEYKLLRPKLTIHK